MDLLQIMLGYITKQYNISEDEAAELLFKKTEDGSAIDKTKLKDDALKSILKMDADRVSTIKGSVDKTQIFNDAYDKAKKEVLSKEEKKIAEKYGIELGSLKLPGLIEEVVKKHLESNKKSEVDEDKIKLHPAYLALEKNSKKAIDDLVAKHTEELSTLNTSYTKKELQKKAKSKALSIFDNLNPVLSKDPIKAARQRDDFSTKFDSYEYQEEGEDLIPMKDGKRLEDKHGHVITLESLTNDLANKYYDFSVQDSKDSSGNHGKTKTKVTGVPKDKDSYNQAIFNATTVEERTALADAWEASGKGA